MADRPILFSGEMVRAILEGCKTQTRRVIKPQPIEVERGYLTWKQGTGHGAGAPVSDAGTWFDCPYGKLGDRLWVRETWMVEQFPSNGSELVHYRADNTAANSGWTAARMWKPSIHMPRRYSRITLEITGVRVERLQDISEADMAAEGLDIAPYGEPCAGFQVLWDGINAKRGYGWDTNPWVWALTFKRVQP